MAINTEVPTAISTPAVTGRVGERQADRSSGVGMRPRDLNTSVMRIHY